MNIHARHSQRMGALHLSLALLYLFSSPVRAQWWSFLWNPKTSPRSSPPSIPPSVSSPSFTSLGPSDTPGTTTAWVTTEKTPEGGTQIQGSVLASLPSTGVSVSGHSTAEPGTLPPEENPGGDSKASVQYKPLKHWKSGECYRDAEENSTLAAIDSYLVLQNSNG